jgi:hypothetical protein
MDVRSVRHVITVVIVLLYAAPAFCQGRTIMTCVLHPLMYMGNNTFLYYSEYHEYESGTEYDCSGAQAVYSIGLFNNIPQDCDEEECLAETIEGDPDGDRIPIQGLVFPGLDAPKPHDYVIPALMGSQVVQCRYVVYKFTIDRAEREFKAKVFSIFTGNDVVDGRIIEVAVQIQEFPENEVPQSVAPAHAMSTEGDYAFSLKYGRHRVLLLTAR